jgi:acid phosphatase family membrane protein YuiD
VIEMPFLTIPLIAWIVAQLSKFATTAFRGKVDFHKLYESGGMPSAHTALISASTVAIGVIEGGRSPIFGFAAALTTIIVYDAIGVRRASGLQAEAIRYLYKQRVSSDEPALGTARGHSPGEVMAGAALGIGLALLLTYDLSLARLSPLIEFPAWGENRTLAAGLAVVVILTTRIARKWSGKRLPYTLIAMTGLMAAVIVWFCAANRVPLIGYRLAYLITSMAFIAATGFIAWLAGSAPPATKGPALRRPSKVRKKASRRPKRR